MDQPVVEIFLLKYKSPTVESSCIDSILHNTEWPYHLHIVDNRKGTKNTGDIWNRLIKDWGHYYYKLFIDSDTLVEKLWLTKMMAVMLSKKSDAGVVVPRTDNCGEIRQVHTGTNVSTRKLLPTDPVVELPLASGFCFLFNYSSYQHTGDFDYTNFTFYGQDSEWFIRMRAKTKYKIYLQPASFVHHRGAHSVNEIEDDSFDFKKDKQNSLKNFWAKVEEYGVGV